MSSSSCAVGFLNRQSLNQIVDAPRDDSIHRSLRFRWQGTHLSMPLTGSGRLVRFIIAAKHDHSIPSGWPTLQVRRRVGNNSHKVVAMTTLEPRQTGYLNVFEYNLSAEVQSGDVVCVLNHTPEPVTESSGQRYLLAYVRETSKPMVSIEVSDNNQSITTLSMVTDDCSTVSNTSPKTYGGDHVTTAAAAVTNTAVELTTTMKLSSSRRKQPVIAIVGGVLCILVVLILLTGVSTTLFVIYRHKNKSKDSSAIPIHNFNEVSNTNTCATECIEVDTNQAYFVNSVPTEPNVAYGTPPLLGPKSLDYDYVVL